jgi:SAM-dependent methyltransferase
MTMNQVATKPAFDQAEAETFQGRLADVLNGGAVAFMVSVGHRTGLFDTMATLPPATSNEIARAAALNERYVREWLAVMVTGGVVRFDGESGRYELPPEHAASLTRRAALGNLAVYAQIVGMAAAMQDRLLAAFETGEGIAYEHYPCFHQIMSEDSGQTVVAGIGEIVDTLIPEQVERLEAGIDVLDAGCGAGLALVAMAERFPNSRFTGYDLGPDAIAMARKSGARLDNVTFEVRDLNEFRDEAAFDLITSFDAVHDTKDPAVLLVSYHRALRSGGVHLMQDIAGSARLENNLQFPFAPFLYAVSCVHCMPVSLAQGGKGLGTMWGWETAEAMLREAGFAEITRTVLPHDPMNVWFVSRKP